MSDSLKQFALRVLTGEDRSWRAAGLRTATALVEPLYSTAMTLRNRLYDVGALKTHDLGRPAISVGNITTGGTGKTPVVQWLAQQLQARGRQPAILLRGYGSSAGASDEAELLRNSLTIPVQPCPSRIDGAAHVLREHPEVDLFLLDDAFQHRRVKRNYNLVLISATNPFGFGHVLPRGLLREPLIGLTRADAFVITRCSLVSPESLAQTEGLLRKRHPGKSTFYCDHQLCGLWSPSADQTMPMGTLAGKHVFLLAGIGDPLSFLKQVTSSGCTIVGSRWFDDHHNFSSDDINSLLLEAKKLGADHLITTEKDWVKLKGHWPESSLIAIVKLKINFRNKDGSALLTQLLQSI
jgi:tetraacyldisaccharide 4'-kinase